MRVPRRRSDLDVEGGGRQGHRHARLHRPRLADGSRLQGAAGVHAQCPQSGTHGEGRRQEHRLRADVWRSLCARPRQQPALRLARRPQQPAQAGLHVAGAAFVELHHLRADGNSGAEAASPHHPFRAQAFRQALHGHRHLEGARRGRDEDGGHRVRRGLCEGQHRRRLDHQLQFAAGVGFHHAGCDEGLCPAQPAADPRALRAVRRIDHGLCRGRRGAGQCGSPGGRRLHAAHQAGVARRSTASSW